MPRSRELANKRKCFLLAEKQKWDELKLYILKDLIRPNAKLYDRHGKLHTFEYWVSPGIDYWYAKGEWSLIIKLIKDNFVKVKDMTPHAFDSALRGEWDFVLFLLEEGMINTKTKSDLIDGRKVSLIDVAKEQSGIEWVLFLLKYHYSEFDPFAILAQRPQAPLTPQFANVNNNVMLKRFSDGRPVPAAQKLPPVRERPGGFR